MTSEKRFKKKDAEISVFDAFHAGFVVPLAKFLDGEEDGQEQEQEEEQEEETAVAVVETPKPKPKPKPAPKEDPAPTQEESEVADDNAE